jgi:hypothetical protein
MIGRCYNHAWFAGIAQLVEQRIRNAKVGGSIPLSGTIFGRPTLFVASSIVAPAK